MLDMLFWLACLVALVDVTLLNDDMTRSSSASGVATLVGGRCGSCYLLDKLLTKTIVDDQ